MVNEIPHEKFVLSSLRTATIFILSFLSYEFLKILEIKWNKARPKNHLSHFAHRKIYHFTLIFIIDLLILYSFAGLFGIQL
jgi:hypothetical protein